MPLHPIAIVLLLAYMGAASYFDLKERRIPNKLILVGLGVGLVLYALGLTAIDGINAAFLVFAVMFVAYSINTVSYTHLTLPTICSV